jgi:hypothetical protein
VTPDQPVESALVSDCDRIDIELAVGCPVRVANGVKAAALRQVLDVLDGRRLA